MKRFQTKLCPHLDLQLPSGSCSCQMRQEKVGFTSCSCQRVTPAPKSTFSEDLSLLMGDTPYENHLKIRPELFESSWPGSCWICVFKDYSWAGYRFMGTFSQCRHSVMFIESSVLYRLSVLSCVYLCTRLLSAAPWAYFDIVLCHWQCGVLCLLCSQLVLPGQQKWKAACVNSWQGKLCGTGPARWVFSSPERCAPSNAAFTFLSSVPSCSFFREKKLLTGTYGLIASDRGVVAFFSCQDGFLHVL